MNNFKFILLVIYSINNKSVEYPFFKFVNYIYKIFSLIILEL